jgi:ribonuclease P protein component
MSVRFGSDVRLRTRAQFTAVQDDGRRVATRYVTLLALPNALDRDRLGVIASRRLGGAVVRNRAKRRIRALFRQQEPDLAAARPGRPLDLVVIPKREFASAPYPVIERDFLAALARLDRSRQPR